MCHADLDTPEVAPDAVRDDYAILDRLPVGVIVLHGPRVLHANPAFREQSGFAQAELLRMEFAVRPEEFCCNDGSVRRLYSRAGDNAPDAIFVGMLAPASSIDTSDAARLTPRERQVVQVLATGATNRQISSALKISEHTVKVQLRSIFAKLGVQNRTQLALRARMQR